MGATGGRLCGLSGLRRRRLGGVTWGFGFFKIGAQPVAANRLAQPKSKLHQTRSQVSSQKNINRARINIPVDPFISYAVYSKITGVLRHLSTPLATHAKTLFARVA